MSYNCIIVDDDPASVKVLEKMVEKTSQLHLVGNAKNAMEATNLLQNNNIDIVLLDIEMPGMTGLDLINTLKERPEIILVTSQKEYAIEAFDYEVTDYLLKPVEFKRFFKAINRATENILKSTPQAQNHQSQESEENSPKTIFIKERNQFTSVEKDKIFYVEPCFDYGKI